MTKGQIHFSNHLDELLIILKEKLFPMGANPFQKRLLIVPHLELKSYILQSLAKDPEIQVAAGLKVVNLQQGYAKIAKRNLPHKVELSFFLQHELAPIIEEEPDLATYFQKENIWRRIGPFCDALADYFARYLIFGKNSLPSWQEKLWKKWQEKNTSTIARSNWEIHLFGFSFLPKFYFNFFANQDAIFYLFSPCSIFWGDFYSEKEKKLLRKNLSNQQIDFFEKSFSEQNTLLANWGKIGRIFQIQAEDSEIPIYDSYMEAEGKNCLEKIQNDFLYGNFSKHAFDDSLQFVSASTLLREIEICKDQMYHLCHTKGLEFKDIQIFAPDISLYIPYIHAVFSDLPYGISDIPLIDEDPISRAFFQMLELPKKRFAKEEVLQVLAKLSKFSIDISLVRKWVEKAHIRWGGSEHKKALFYLQDCREDQIHYNTPLGTWEYGMNQLLLGLGELKGIPVVSPAEMGEFDRFFQVMRSLDDDLTPLYDETRWTIPTWIRYLACLLESYFSIDPSHVFYKELLQLAAKCDSLDREKFPYETIERIVKNIMTRPSQSHQPPHLQALRFGSLHEGCLQPSRAIFLLGMGEEAFPRKEHPLSFFVDEKDFCPKLGDQDRYLFLEAICSAKEFFSMSYVRDPEGKLGASYLVDEFLQSVEGAKILHHPASSHDPEYFGGSLQSYNQKAFQIAQLLGNSAKSSSSLIPNFYQNIDLNLQPLHPEVIELQKLFKFSRHPLRYYFHEILGIYPEFDPPASEEYFLDRRTKTQLVRKALTRPLEEVLEEEKSVMPVHLFKLLSVQQIYEEVREWKEAMEFLDIAPENLETKRIVLEIGPIQLKGRFDFFSEKAILVKGKNHFEDQIKYWPQALLAKHLGLSLFFTKDQSFFTPQGSLENYLSYFQLARQHPSPCIPSLVKPMMKKELRKKLKQISEEDEIFKYLIFRDSMPNAMIIEENWSEILPTVFGGVLANI